MMNPIQVIQGIDAMRVYLKTASTTVSQMETV